MHKQLTRSVLGGLLTVGVLGTSDYVHAQPQVVQIAPVAVYQDLGDPLGLTYDPVNNLITFSRHSGIDALAHTLRPYRSYSEAELAVLPSSGEIKLINLTDGRLDVAGTTGFGISPTGNARALGFDLPSGQLVAQGNGNVLVAVDPLTDGEGLVNNFRPDSALAGFSDGLDVEGGNTWWSGEDDHIYNNGVLFANKFNAAQRVTIAEGASFNQTQGWAGVEQITLGDDPEETTIWSVARFNGDNVGRSRTLAQFDTDGNLIRFDPDGDDVAARWEDLAFDGRFLYAADVFGNENNNGIRGDIYVFDVLQDGTSVIPEPASIGVLIVGGLVLSRRRVR